jgi:hypothetical protein
VGVGELVSQVDLESTTDLASFIGERVMGWERLDDRTFPGDMSAGQFHIAKYRVTDSRPWRVMIERNLDHNPTGESIWTPWYRIGDAWEVLERLQALEYALDICLPKWGGEVRIVLRGSPTDIHIFDVERGMEADSVAHAICLIAREIIDHNGQLGEQPVPDSAGSLHES